jgi:SAM-dependent methyltransferase
MWVVCGVSKKWFDCNRIRREACCSASAAKRVVRAKRPGWGAKLCAVSRGVKMGAITSFLRFNKHLSLRMIPDHVHEANVFGVYKKIGTIVLSHPEVHRVADVGAGKDWQFPIYYKDWYGIELIGIDIDSEEMKDNAALDRRIVCSATGDIPLEDGSIDLVSAHSGVEHFEDNERFLRNAYRILRPGGYLLALFPNRYALFALANRLLPAALAKRLLRISMGETDLLGFKAYYDRTNYSAFRRISERTGFEIVYYLPGYLTSTYLAFFNPLFLISYGLDTANYMLGIRNLATYNLFLLQKPAPDGLKQPLRLYAWK